MVVTILCNNDVFVCVIGLKCGISEECNTEMAFSFDIGGVGNNSPFPDPPTKTIFITFICTSKCDY